MPSGIYKRTSNMKTGTFNHKKGESASNFKDGRCLKKHYCKESGCNNEISYWNFLYGKGRCKPCSSKGERNGNFDNHKLAGKNHFNYIDGRSLEVYPSEYTLYLRQKIRKRDKYTCQLCGITEEEHIILIGQVLNVHHIDYNKQNCNEENLITLCHKCNLRVNFNREYWKNYFSSVILALV